MNPLFRNIIGTICTLGFLCMSSGIVSAQNRLPKNEADSLFSVWKNVDQSPEQRGEALYEYTLGYRRIRPDSALYYSKILYQFAEAHDLFEHRAKSLYQSGVAYYDLGKYDVSLTSFDRSIEQYEKIQDSNALIFTCAFRGNALKILGELDQAEESFQRALTIARRIEKTGVIPALYGSLARIYQSRENYAKAAAYYIDAGKMMKLYGRETSLAVNYGNLGNLYSQQGNLKKALEAYQKGLKYARKYDDQRVLGSYNQRIGDFHFDKGEIDSAFYYYHYGLMLNKRMLNEKKITNSLIKIARRYSEIGVVDSSLHYFNDAFLRSSEIEYVKGQISSLIGKTKLYNRIGEFERAIGYGRQVYDIVQKTGITSQFDLISEELYSSYYQLNKIDSATYFLKELIAFQRKSLYVNYPVLSEQDKALFFGTMQESFEYLNDFLYQESGDAELLAMAYDNSLLLKGMMLRSSNTMRNSILNSGDSTLTLQFNEWLSYKEEIAEKFSDNFDPSRLIKKADSLEQQLINNSSAFSDMQAGMNSSWKKVQQVLEDGDIAIEFIRFNHRPQKEGEGVVAMYSALLIDNEMSAPQQVNLCTELELEKLLGLFPGNNKTYIEKLYGLRTERKQELYDLLWSPLEPFLTGKENLYYSLDGLLHKIAFAPLSDGNGELLCDKHNLRLLSSTGDLIRRNKDLLLEDLDYQLFGGVLYNSDSTQYEVWKYLEGTKKEVDGIASILAKNNEAFTLYKDENATEENFKSSVADANILHIATHGYFYPDPELAEEEIQEEEELNGDINFRGTTGMPSGYASFVHHPNPLMRSGLALAGANDVWTYDLASKNDGVLTAQEVGLLDLRETKLVLLSACETGLGDIKSYEGVYGLQRSFKVAGAERIIMSLWQVPDKETAEFMELFYRILLKKGNISQAFIKAQRTMRKKYDPYFWAAFVLVE